MGQTFFYIIIGILLAEYLLARLLDYLDSRLYSHELPPEVADVYDAEQYRRSQEYSKTKKKFGVVTGTFSLLLMLIMLATGGFGWLDHLVAGLSAHPVWTGLLFFGVLLFASDIIMLPFSAWFVFGIEERFGFNRTTLKTFIFDKLKSWLLAVIIGGGLIAAVIWIYTLTGSLFWLLAWAVVTLFSVFMSMFYSQLIVPLFNKQKPLEPGPLRDAILHYCRETGFRLDNVFVIDGSKRSKKANAYFTGLGSRKRIVLYDTLISEHSTEELVAVLAHETGHYKKKHTLMALIVSVLTTGLMLFVFSFFIESAGIAAALGAGAPAFHVNLLAFGMLYSPISMITGLLMNHVSRRNEYAADRYAAETFSAEALQSALKKLSVNNLSNLKPHPASVFFHYSHPPLLKRLRALKNVSGAKGDS